MICLADNDYLLKLAACDLLDETISLLGIATSNVFVLPTAKYKIAKDTGGRLRARYRNGIDRALAFLDSVSEISVTPNADEQALLNEVKDPDTGQRLIHEGEQILLGTSGAFGEFLLATGDKNCLRALAAARTCEEIYVRHISRVICIEQTILWLIEDQGFQYVLRKVVPASRCDTALQAAFGSGLNAQQEDVIYTLTKYMEELSRMTEGLLKLYL